MAIITEFLRLGIRHLVLSPGSRSQALALAAAEFERSGLLRLHVRIDERSAGFLALGIAVETATPVLVLTTSGTAVANLHPAVLEAHHAGVPLIVLTADRPEELRGIGSNQTTRQAGIFGVAVRRAFDVPAPVGDPGEARRAARIARDAVAAASGPVHVNLAFAEPLSAAGSGLTASITLPAVAAHVRASDPPTAIEPVPGTIVVAGHGAGDAAERAARELAAPLIAEVTSGARFGPNLVVAYRELLADPDFGGRVRRILVFGHPTLSREVPALIERADVETTVVRTASAEDYNPGRRVARFVTGVAVRNREQDPEATAWVRRWVHASRLLVDRPGGAPDVAASRSQHPRERAAFARAELAVVREPVTRRLLAETVWRATWPHDRLVLGASRLIRAADRTVPGKKIRVHANRGLAGIDGTIATGIGIALASQEDAGSLGVTRVMLGDLALLHDVGSMLIGEGESRPRIQVIVGNDGGGTIFDGLEVAGTADPAAIDRVLYTPQRAELSGFAAAYGWAYRRAASRGELEQALTAADPQLLIEVPLPR